jgi:hypothetical protein
MPESTTKTCQTCREPINADARVCPHCRRWQATYAVAIYGFLGVYVACAVGLQLWAASSHSSILGSEPFAKDASELSIVESSMHYGAEGKCNNISTIGTIRNIGDIPWENLKLEVRYSDAAGNLIDTESSEEYGLVVPAHGESAFRLRAAADKPREVYSSHKVFIKGGRDARFGF